MTVNMTVTLSLDSICIASPCPCMTTSPHLKCVPTFCRSIIIHICPLLFFLIEYSSLTDLAISKKVADSTRAQVGKTIVFCVFLKDLRLL